MLLQRPEEGSRSTVPPVAGPLSWSDVLRTWCTFDVPEGWRIKVTTEGLTMSPAPFGDVIDLTEVLGVKIDTSRFPTEDPRRSR